MKKIIFIHTKESTGSMLACDLHSLHRLKNYSKYNSYIGMMVYHSKYSIISLKVIVTNKYQNGLAVVSKAIEESHLLKEYPNVKTIVLK